MRLFVIRHGQTTANVAKIFGGQHDYKLTEQGKEQAMSIRPILAKFHFDRVYSSDLSRAIDTQRLAIPDVEGIRTPLLREIHVGSLLGKTFSEVQESLGGKRPIDLPGQYANFGGESAEMVAERVREFLTMLEEDPCENVAAFAHNGTLGIMMETILGAQIDRTRIPSNNCAIHVYEYSDGKWKLLAWNYMGTI